MTETDFERPSTPSLIGDAIKQATELVAAEIQLVRFEATEKLVAALIAVASMFAAAVFMIVALIFLLQALIEFLVHIGWQPFAASLAVGGGIAAIALVTILVALRQLTAAKMKPKRVLRQVKQTTDMVKDVAR